MEAFNIRHAKLKDLDGILADLKDFSAFYNSKFKMYGDDDEYSRKLVSSLIDDHAFFIAETSEGKLAGLICGVFSPHVYNPTIMCLTESFWWVKPAFRKSGAGLLLLNRFIEYGKEHAQWIICTLEDESPVHPVTFYKRGFKLKEQSFLLEV